MAPARPPDGHDRPRRRRRPCSTWCPAHAPDAPSGPRPISRHCPSPATSLGRGMGQQELRPPRPVGSSPWRCGTSTGPSGSARRRSSACSAATPTSARSPTTTFPGRSFSLWPEPTAAPRAARAPASRRRRLERTVEPAILRHGSGSPSDGSAPWPTSSDPGCGCCCVGLNPSVYSADAGHGLRPSGQPGLAGAAGIGSGRRRPRPGRTAHGSRRRHDRPGQAGHPARRCPAPATSTGPGFERLDAAVRLAEARGGVRRRPDRLAGGQRRPDGGRGVAGRSTGRAAGLPDAQPERPERPCHRRRPGRPPPDRDRTPATERAGPSTRSTR